MTAEPTPTERLNSITEALSAGGVAPSLTVRGFLWWWKSSRRGYWIVKQIRDALNGSGLRTEPDFEAAYLDSQITFLLSKDSRRSATERPPEVEALQPAATETSADPTYRISKLAAANNRPQSVAPNATLGEVVTLLMANDFSQAPVMTTERDVKGIVSWRTIGSRLAMGKHLGTATDAMEPAVEIRATESIFAALPIIVEHQYVLVRGADQRIVGIITTTDIGLQFKQLAEPFLLLGEIENHLRRIITLRFGAEELTHVRDPNDTARVIASVNDLTFGEYRVLFEDPERWARSALPLDRVAFVKLLERLRRIRNDVMHFDPDGIPPDDLEVLRDGTRFLRSLQAIGIA